MEQEIKEVIDFWFGEIRDGFTVEDRSSFWFGSNEDTDRQIKTRFGSLVERASRNALDHWGKSAPGRLALVILLDQFTRNIYRGTGEAFSGDKKALELCREGIELGHDKALPPIQRMFLYMPLEHSENLGDQVLCVALHEEMLQDVAPDKREVVRESLNWALIHKGTIERFGRFPHRNKALGRRSTEAEERYLRGEHKSFGQ